MDMMSSITDELTRIADECDARGLFSIANEIDAALKDSVMRRSAGRTSNLLRLLGISNSLNRFAQVEGPDPFGDDPTPEETAAFHAQLEEESRRREEEFLAGMSPEELKFYLDHGMTIEDARKEQEAEIDAERGSGDWVSGFRHLGDEDERMESEMGLEPFEEFMERVRRANRGIDSSMNRFARHDTLPFDNWNDASKREAPFTEGQWAAFHRSRDPHKDENPPAFAGHGPFHHDDLPSDDPNDPDYVSPDELEAASDLLDSLLSGKLYEGKEFCPDCGMAMRDNIGKEGKHCPHCSLKGQPRISMNMGGIPAGYVRTASKRQDVTPENVRSILERMR